jgi:hypothetical protein
LFYIECNKWSIWYKTRYILDSGFTRYQNEIALKKARIGYQLSNKQNNSKERSITHGDIQIAWTFMRINHEQFKQDILEHEQVLKTMIEKGYTCVKPYGTEEDKVKE